MFFQKVQNGNVVFLSPQLVPPSTVSLIARNHLLQGIVYLSSRFHRIYKHLFIHIYYA